MKLSNQQTTALANQIKENLEKEVNGPIIAANAAIKNSSEYENFYEEDEDCKIITAIAEKNDMSDDYYPKYVKQGIKTNFFESKFMKEKHFKFNLIEREIILGTIEVQNLDELIVKITEKFR